MIMLTDRDFIDALLVATTLEGGCEEHKKFGYLQKKGYFCSLNPKI